MGAKSWLWQSSGDISRLQVLLPCCCYCFTGCLYTAVLQTPCSPYQLLWCSCLPLNVLRFTNLIVPSPPCATCFHPRTKQEIASLGSAPQAAEGAAYAAQKWRKTEVGRNLRRLDPLFQGGWVPTPLVATLSQSSKFCSVGQTKISWNPF